MVVEHSRQRPEAIIFTLQDNKVMVSEKWPKFTQISLEFLDEAASEYFSQLENGDVTFKVANGSARYKLIVYGVQYNTYRLIESDYY